MRELGADRMVPVPAVGRVFAGTRRVRFGDLSPAGRVRFDALARYVQDVSNDDTRDAGLVDDLAWVVRRTVFEVRVPAVFGDEVTSTTFCSGLGSRWAERRISMVGSRGASIEAAVVWVHVELPTARPVPLDDQFLALYGPTAAGREITARLGHDPAVPAGAHRRPWPLRFVDFDPLGHVNNAASWAIVEEVLAGTEGLGPPYRAELEFRAPIERGTRVEVAWSVDEALALWILDADSGTLLLTGSVAALAG